MFKAKNNNTLKDKRQRVYVDGCDIKFYTGLVPMVLKKFQRRDMADAAMAHVWALVASSRDGMTRSEILREINSIKEE